MCVCHLRCVSRKMSVLAAALRPASRHQLSRCVMVCTFVRQHRVSALTSVQNVCSESHISAITDNHDYMIVLIIHIYVTCLS